MEEIAVGIQNLISGRQLGFRSTYKAHCLQFQELREEFDKRGYLLTAALGASRETIDLAYDIKQLKG